MMSGRGVFPPKPQPRPKPGAVKVVKALYKYTGRSEGELSFEEGDVLYVQDWSHPDWWKACCNSKTGLIPSNYVEGTVEEVINPLHEAARRGNLAFLQECLSQRVSATGLDSMSNTPLYWAAHSGHIQCVKCLLNEKNPPVNAQNKFGDTPLHGASAKNHYEVAEMLLEAGADPSIVNDQGEMPEMLAMSTSVKNLLQSHRLNRGIVNRNLNSEDYEDESD